MPQPSPKPNSPASNDLLTLWEAMGVLHQIQTQEKIARDKGDAELLQNLLEEQAEAWEVVCRQAGELIVTGQAPTNMIQQLEKILNIHRNRQKGNIEVQTEIEELAEVRETINGYQTRQDNEWAA